MHFVDNLNDEVSQLLILLGELLFELLINLFLSFSQMISHQGLSLGLFGLILSGMSD